MARTPVLIVAVAVAVVVVIGLMRPPGSARSDEVADVVTNAISYPPKGSAAGLARAAQNTGSVIVYAAEDLAPVSLATWMGPGSRHVEGTGLRRVRVAAR